MFNVHFYFSILVSRNVEYAMSFNTRPFTKFPTL